MQEETLLSIMLLPILLQGDVQLPDLVNLEHFSDSAFH